MHDFDNADRVESLIIDLLSSYCILKSSMEIFTDAVDYDTDLDSKYNSMVKVIDMLVLSMEPSIEQLCMELKVLLDSTEK